MMVDTTVYGFVGDGAVIHNNDRCAPDLFAAVDGSHRYVDADGADYGPLYYMDDDGNGLTCDACYEYIFEPSCPECGADTSIDDHGEPALCEACVTSAQDAAREGDAPGRYASDAYRVAWTDARDSVHEARIAREGR